MAVSDFLSDLGGALSTTGRVVGAVAAPLAQSIGNEEAGYAPAIAAQQRQHQQDLEDAAINVKAKALEDQMALGEKYGTLTPDDRQQYVDAITNLYSHPRHAATLMEKLRQAIHPQGATYTAPEPVLKSAVPAGGTAAADQANAEKLAEARYTAMMRNNPRMSSLNGYTQDKYGVAFPDATPEQQEEALESYGKSTRAPKYTSHIVADSDSPTGFSYATWDVDGKHLVSKMPGVTPPRGYYPTERVSRATDQYGNVTESVSEVTPQIPGMGSTPPLTPPSGTAAPTPTKPSIGGTKPSIGGIVKPVVPTRKMTSGVPISATPGTVLPRATSAPPPLDSEGHIPEGVGNPQVRELANQLLDGKDLDKLPAKAKAPASQLARQYGWEQGKFTPREQSQIRVASTMLQDARNNPVLDIFDDQGFLSKLKSNYLTRPANANEGLIGSMATALSSSSATPQQAEYARLYKQLAGTISGLGPTLRSKGMTEATVDRLLTELPDPLTTSSKADAQQRIDRLLNEINVALQKGTFEQVPTSGGTAGALGGSLADRLRKRLAEGTSK